MSDQIIDLTEPVMPASSETVREARSAGGTAGHAAAELALAAVNHRLDRLVASGADGGDVGTELRDIRVMRDGTAASTAGGAVRTQVDAAKQANGQLSLASLDFDGIGSRYLCDNLTMHRHKMLTSPISCKGDPLDDAVLKDAKFASISDPVLVRAADGNPIIRNLTITGASSTGATCAIYWNADGQPSGDIHLNDLPADLIPESAVWMSFVEYDNYPQCRWRLASRTVEWLNTGSGVAEYTVGADGDWQSLTECLHALKDDATEKTIRVMPGEYDIFEELGGAGKWASYDGSDNWRDVQPVVPPNTRLVGMGRVTLRMTPTASQISRRASTLLSPLNVSGTCTIENLRVIARNCRYAIHDECSGRAEFDGATHIYRNITCEKQTPDEGWGYAQTIGSGEPRNGTILFEDCEIRGASPYTIHTNVNQAGDRTLLTFRHCLIEGGAGQAVGLSTSWNNLAENHARFDSCHLNGGIRTYNEQSGSDKPNSWRITLVNCNADAAITHSNKNTLDPQVVNPIPVTGGTAMNDTTNTTAAIGGGLSLPSLAHAARRIDWTVAA